MSNFFVIYAIIFLYFVGFNVDGFSLELVKIYKFRGFRN